jgi:hypothetical protein
MVQCLATGFKQYLEYDDRDSAENVMACMVRRHDAFGIPHPVPHPETRYVEPMPTAVNKKQ